jgi:hypothetical protein
MDAYTPRSQKWISVKFLEPSKTTTITHSESELPVLFRRLQLLQVNFPFTAYAVRTYPLHGSTHDNDIEHKQGSSLVPASLRTKPTWYKFLVFGFLYELLGEDVALIKAVSNQAL